MGNRVEVEFAVLDKLSAHVKQMNDTMTGFSKSVTNSFGSITKGLVSVGAAFGAFQGAKFLGDMVQKGIDYGDTVTDMARRTGLTTDAVQELSFVAKQTGTSMESLQKSFIMLSKKAYDNDKIFGTLGISLKDNNGILKDSGALFNESILKLSGIQNVTERTALAQKLFGKASIEVNGIISQGSERITELLGQTNKYSLVLDKGMIEKLHDAKEQQELWNQQIVIMTARISTLALPLIEKWMTGVSDLLAAEEKWQKLKSATVDPRAIALAKEIETLSLAKTKAEENGFAIVKVNSAYVTWTGTVEEAKQVLIDLQAEQSKILNTVPTKTNAPTITDPDADKDRDKRKKAADQRIKEETERVNNLFKNIDDEFKTSEFNALDVFFGDREEQENKIKETNDLFSQLTDNLEKEDKAATENLLESQEEIRRSERETARAKKEAVSDTVSSLQYLAGKHREFMGLYKVAAIFQIGADTFASAQAAFRGFQKLPQPFGMIAGGIAAGAITIAGIERANEVRKQNFAGGGAAYNQIFRAGEQGPEDIMLMGGARIYNNTETRNNSSSHSTYLTANFYDQSGTLSETFRKEIRSGSADQVVRDLQNKMARSL